LAYSAIINLMSIIKIQYNLEKDLENYDYNYLSEKFPSYGRDDSDYAPRMWPTVKQKVNDADESDKLPIIREYLIDNFEVKKIVDSTIKSILEYWETIEAAYFNKLCKFMDVSHNVKDMDVYITTMLKCPYNSFENYFYISFFSCLSIQVETIMHESMHLVFRQSYDKYITERGVDSQGLLEINEAMTVLLNFEFREFLVAPAWNNKPSIKDLKEEMVIICKAHKPFKEMLDRLIDMRAVA